LIDDSTDLIVNLNEAKQATGYIHFDDGE